MEFSLIYILYRLLFFAVQKSVLLNLLLCFYLLQWAGPELKLQLKKKKERSVNLHKFNGSKLN